MKILLIILKPLLIQCRQASELMSKEIDTSIGFSNKVRLAIHNTMCLPCAYLRKQYRFIDLILKRMETMHQVHAHEHLDIEKKVLLKKQLREFFEKEH